MLDVAEVFEGLPRVPGPTNVVSIVAIQRGTTDPDRFVLLSGDLDSRVSDIMNAVDSSPGANDNASGVAAVLEAARVLSARRFRGSIVYAALSGEENGLLGGQTVAALAAARGWRMTGVINNDMIGNVDGGRRDPGHHHGARLLRGYVTHRDRLRHGRPGAPPGARWTACRANWRATSRRSATGTCRASTCGSSTASTGSGAGGTIARSPTWDSPRSG